MSKYIKITALILSVLSVILFCSCKKQEPEKVTVETSLSVDNSFCGQRNIKCSFPQSIIPQGSEQETHLDKVIQKYCPDSVNYSKNISENAISYNFQLKFSSATDYTDKVKSITKTQAAVSFSNPNTVLTKGWKLEENFQSSQLLDWIFDGARQENFDDLKFEITETKTSAALNDDVQNSKPVISVNNLSGYPIQKISINTVNKNTVYDRTIVFIISQTTFDSLGDKLSQYFKNITDDSASSAEWILDNNSYLYTVKFTDVSIKELEGYTNRLLSSVYSDIRYEDKTKGSTPLAKQNCFYEILDFSNYVGNSNSNVPVEYSYTVNDSSELGECMLYRDNQWVAATDLLDTNIYGKKVAIKSTDSLLNLKISDGKQYIASSVGIDVKSLDNELIQKTLTFRYDIATGGNEASDYTKSYFDALNIGTVQTISDGQNICTVTVSGDSSKVNSVMTKVFGDDNTISCSSYCPAMSLRTVRQYTDHVNMSSLLVGKNTDLPIIYSVTAQNSNDIVKSINAKSANTGTLSDNSTNSDNSVTVQTDGKNQKINLNGAVNDISFDVSVPNMADIVLFGIIAFIITAVALIIIFYLKGKKSSAALPPAEKHKILPEIKNKLTKKDNRK